MKNLKKLVGAALGAAMLTLGTSTYAAGINPKYFPTDIKDHWAYTQIDDLVKSDVLNGYGDQTIKPNGMITRAEFAQILVNAVGKQTLEGFTSQDKSFTDVKEGQWYYEPVHLLASIGFVNGVDAEHFEPNRNIQRDEITKMIVNVFQVTDGTYPPLTKQFIDVPDQYWAKPYIDLLAKADLINGYADGRFQPTAYATRAEASAMIYNALHKQEGGPEDATLTQPVQTHEQEAMKLMASKDFQGLHDLNEKDCTGYFLDMNNAGVDKMKELIDQGFSLSVSFKSEPEVKVIEKSSFSATVQLTESVEMTYQKGDFSQTTDADTSAYLLMKRMPDHTWKVYDEQPLENQTDETK